MYWRADQRWVHLPIRWARVWLGTAGLKPGRDGTDWGSPSVLPSWVDIIGWRADLWARPGRLQGGDTFWQAGGTWEQVSFCRGAVSSGRGTVRHPETTPIGETHDCLHHGAMSLHWFWWVIHKLWWTSSLYGGRCHSLIPGSFWKVEKESGVLSDSLKTSLDMEAKSYLYCQLASAFFENISGLNHFRMLFPGHISRSGWSQVQVHLQRWITTAGHHNEGSMADNVIFFTNVVVSP